jgi:hypothetical protein
VLLIHPFARACSCVFIRAQVAGVFCCVLTFSVLVLVSPFPRVSDFFDFPETSLIFTTFYPLKQKVIDLRVKDSTRAHTHTRTKREREREREKRTSLLYNLRGRVYLVFSSFCLFLWKRVCVQITVRGDERTSFPGAQPTRGQRLPVPDVLSV